LDKTVCQKNVEYKEEMDLNWRRLSSDHDITLQNLASGYAWADVFF
jgi:hypothetical protein